MTCIVGVVDGGKVVIAADSLGSNNSCKVERKDSKLFKNGEFIVGCTGSFRMIQVLQYSVSFPKIYDKDLMEYMCTDFVDTVRSVFKEKGYTPSSDDGDTGGDFLVGIRGRLFHIQSDFQVEETCNDFNACGSGVYYALGALEANKSYVDNCVDRAVNAISVASKFNPFVGGEIKTIVSD